mgnify:CR=1 FL=1
MSIAYACYLVNKKNELNKKRRRFYNLIRQSYFANRDSYYKHGDLKFYTDKYEECKMEMRRMTKEMSGLRKKLDISYCWNAGGSITHIYIKHSKSLLDNKAIVDNAISFQLENAILEVK